MSRCIGIFFMSEHSVRPETLFECAERRSLGRRSDNRRRRE